MSDPNHLWPLFVLLSETFLDQSKILSHDILAVMGIHPSPDIYRRTKADAIRTTQHINNPIWLMLDCIKI